MATAKVRVLYMEHDGHLLLYGFEKGTRKYIASKVWFDFRGHQEQALTKEIVSGLHAAIGTQTQQYFPLDDVATIVEEHKLDIMNGANILINLLKTPPQNKNLSQTVVLKDVNVLMNGPADFDFVLTRQMIERAMSSLVVTFLHCFLSFVNDIEGRKVTKIFNPGNNILRLPTFKGEAQLIFKHEIFFVNDSPGVRVEAEANYHLSHHLIDMEEETLRLAAALAREIATDDEELGG